MATYPNAPAVGKTDTSAGAVEVVAPRSIVLREKVLAFIAAAHNGATTTEITQALSEDYSAVQPRTSELRKQGKIRDSRLRRLNLKSNKEIVWVIEGATREEENPQETP